RDLALGADGDLNEVSLRRRATGELANEFGNLAHRTLSMTASYFGGAVPEPASLQDADVELNEAGRALLSSVRADITEQALHTAIGRIWEVVTAANRYLDGQR